MNENDSQYFEVNLNLYSGPLNTLLDLAKAQKVDLLNISITQLADQFIEFINSAKKINLDTNTAILVKKKFNGILQGFLGYSDKKGKNVSTLIAERMHISAFFAFFAAFLAASSSAPSSSTS